MQYRSPSPSTSTSTSTSSATVTSDEGKSGGQKELTNLSHRTLKRRARQDLHTASDKHESPSKWFKEHILKRDEEDAKFQENVLNLLKSRDDAMKKFTEAYIANINKHD